MTITRLFVATLTVAVVFATGSWQTSSGATRGKITTKGFGPVLAGMTVAEASKALGVRLVSEHQPVDENCSYVNPERGFPGLSFMVIDGHIARVDVESKTYTTPSGARVGDTEARIKSLYKDQLKIEPHRYVDGHYLIFVPKDAADKDYRIIFETDGKRVTHIRAGRLPEVEYIEGCS